MESSLGSSAADDVLLASTADSRADTSHVSESSASARGGGDGDDAELVRLRAQVANLKAALADERAAAAAGSLYAPGSGGDGAAAHAPRRRMMRAGPPEGPPNYRLGEVIGRGQFGVVRKGLSLLDGGFVAVKEVALPPARSHEYATIRREVETMSHLRRHANVVS